MPDRRCHLVGRLRRLHPPPSLVRMLGACVLAGAAGGAEYVVAATGNDANPGTLAQPWLTLQHAANTVQPGDTVTLLPGSYAGFTLTTSGTAAAPITFQANAGAQVTAATPTGNLTDGVDIEGADYVVITGFTVIGMPRSGITSRLNQHCTITNNTCDRNGSWGIFTSHSDDLLIQGNVCTNSQQQHGIYVSNACVNPVVRGNTCAGNADLGIHLNGDLSDGGTGVISGAVIDGNILHDNVGNGIDGDGVVSSTYENNFCYDNGGNGISLFQEDGAQGPTGDIIVNNTILVPSTGRWGIALQNNGGSNVIVNNILLVSAANHGSINSDSATGFVSDYNIVVNAFSVDYGDVLTLAQWQATTGQDLHSFQAAASSLFADPSGSSYLLQAGSPAIDAGTTLDAPDHDLSGTARPQGNGFDIGADEFVASSSTGTGAGSSSSTAGSTSTTGVAGGSGTTGGTVGAASSGSGGRGCGLGASAMAVLLLARCRRRR